MNILLIIVVLFISPVYAEETSTGTILIPQWQIDNYLMQVPVWGASYKKDNKKDNKKEVTKWQQHQHKKQQ